MISLSTHMSQLLTTFFSTLTNYFSSFFELISLKKRNRKLNTEFDTVYTYRGSSQKPQVVESRPFELFYRNRSALIAFQTLVLILLGLWTVWNYIHVFKNL